MYLRSENFLKVQKTVDRQQLLQPKNPAKPVKTYTRTDVFSQRQTFPYKATTKMLYWQYMLKGHEMPAYALDGGSRKRKGPKRVIARAWYEGNLVPGYVKQETGVGYFAFENDVVITRDEFEVLVSTDVESFAWATNFSSEVPELPPCALKGGCTFLSVPLYIGCVTIHGVELCGHIKNRRCYVALDTKQVVESDQFCILVDLTNETLCAETVATAEIENISSDTDSEINIFPVISDDRTISENEAVQAATSVAINRPKRDNEIGYENRSPINFVELSRQFEEETSAKNENMSKIDHEAYLAGMSDDDLADYLANGGTL
ncbi:Hypothetical predicted protein [Cloeon dipterum]|uniref:Uncharacterized protein n=2 Tax=Cloeon dipterum TaxID=197152 RepID=A0A8S1E367_9INSE|nr:Hypothetical predicted protein [Cloeon dipterum]